ncbi:MAG: hypothetical protein HQL08_15150 [Nitrospirae bacterium]|nr:hypothetical protein [Nitrospirota bacterium]
METSIPEIYNGVSVALSTITNNSLYIETLYVVVAMASFFWIFIEFRGTNAILGNLRNHFITLMFIWLFFGSGALTSDVNVTLNNPDGTTTCLTYQMAPGFKYVTYVINSVAGWASGAIGKASLDSLNIDVSKMPFAAEKYALKAAKTEQMLAAAAKDPLFDDKNRFYANNCLDTAKIKANPPKFSFQIYIAAYIRDNPPPNPECNNSGSWLYNKAYAAVQDIAQKNNLTTDDVARIAPKSWLLRQVDKINPANLVIALAEAILSVFLRVVSVVTYATAFIYVKALPFFLGILNQMYVGVYPLIVAMAMLPGRWMAIVTYFEGYLWLAFMPVVIAAVDGFGMQLTGIISDLLSLPATMVMLAKISIVMSVPAITSFLIFGQRTYRVGPSDVARNAAYSAASLVSRGVGRAFSSGRKGGPAGPGAAQASRILDGGGGWGGGGNVVASTGGRGQPPVGIPVTTAASNYDMHRGNSESLKNAMAAVTGDNSASPPDYIGKEMVSGHIKCGSHGGELGGALKNISPELLELGVTAQVNDSVGASASVRVQTGADGKARYSMPEGGTAADGAMAARMSSAGKGEMYAARIVTDGHKFTYTPGGGAHVSKLRWGNEMSSENLNGEDLYYFISQQQKKLL